LQFLSAILNISLLFALPLVMSCSCMRAHIEVALPQFSLLNVLAFSFSFFLLSHFNVNHKFIEK
jgi:hypothetical protein